MTMKLCCEAGAAAYPQSCPWHPDAVGLDGFPEYTKADLATAEARGRKQAADALMEAALDHQNDAGQVSTSVLRNIARGFAAEQDTGP